MSVMTEEETEVRRSKRTWPAQYKLNILNEIEEAKAAGELGAVGEICRREGLYSSLITAWRQQRDDGALEGLGGKPVGRPKKDRTAENLARLRARVAQLEGELDTANELIEAQGKVSALLQAKSRKSADPTANKP
ncbi:MAG: transposase [Candidatus Nanopelagicales bacterium]